MNEYEIFEPKNVPNLVNNLSEDKKSAYQNNKEYTPYIVKSTHLLKIMPYMGVRTNVPQSPGKTFTMNLLLI